jgi:two-component system nitrate/nitrite response regulator NarL
MVVDGVPEQQGFLRTQDAGEPTMTLLLCKSSLVRTGLRRILAGTRFTVLDETVTSRSPGPALHDALPVLCIVDESHSLDELPALVAHLKTQYPSARVVLLYTSLEPKALRRAYEAGLSGICSTAMRPEALFKALELVMLGEPFIPSAVALDGLGARSCGHQTRSTLSAKPRNLSNREAEILHCLMQGVSNKVIARKLDVMESTVKVHLKAILRKIGATNRTQAAIWATEHLRATVDNETSAPAGH